jgi:hypothetical protein
LEPVEAATGVVDGPLGVHWELDAAAEFVKVAKAAIN